MYSKVIAYSQRRLLLRTDTRSRSIISKNLDIEKSRFFSKIDRDEIDNLEKNLAISRKISSIYRLVNNYYLVIIMIVIYIIIVCMFNNLLLYIFSFFLHILNLLFPWWCFQINISLIKSPENDFVFNILTVSFIGYIYLITLFMHIHWTVSIFAGIKIIKFLLFII